MLLRDAEVSNEQNCIIVFDSAVALEEQHDRVVRSLKFLVTTR